MRTIDITQILSPDLKSRMRAQDLKLFVQNCGAHEVILDFSNVKFATRSFIDEFYNLFLKSPEQNPFTVSITNVPEDINAMIESVSNTQTKAKVIPSTSEVITFKTVDEAIEYLNTATV